MKTRRIGLLPAVVLAIGGLIAGGHLAATLAFTGPQTPLKSSLQPALNNYFLGPLDQGWSPFAPGVYSQDEYFLMRACLSSLKVCESGEKGGAKFSEWRNVTAEEMKSAEHNIFSDRGSKQSKVIAARFWSAASALPSAQSALAQANHVGGSKVFGVDLSSKQAKDKYSPNLLSKLQSYERMENVAVGFASLKANEYWGAKATLVEVRMRRDPVVPFEQRRLDNKPPASTFMKIGWRDVNKFDPETMAAWK